MRRSFFVHFIVLVSALLLCGVSQAHDFEVGIKVLSVQEVDTNLQVIVEATQKNLTGQLVYRWYRWNNSGDEEHLGDGSQATVLLPLANFPLEPQPWIVLRVYDLLSGAEVLRSRSTLCLVYAWWPETSSVFATNAPFRIVHPGAPGGEVRVMSQKDAATAKWHYLGTFLFEAGEGGYVELSDAADGRLLADAVKFVPEGE